MLHEITGHLFKNEFLHRQSNPTDIVLYYDNQNVLMISEDGEKVHLPTFGELLPTQPDVLQTAQFLFTVDDQGFYLADQIATRKIERGVMRPIGAFREFLPQHLGFAGITGSQLYRFYRGNTYCGYCGARMEKSKVERALCCPECSSTVYPKISPAVIVGIVDGDRMLMTKYAGRSFARYALVAGFTEFGEPVERTVSREVKEEVGLHVKNIRYFKSQPWAFSDSLLMGFFCDLDGDDAVSLDDHELSEATWFHRDQMEKNENLTSLTNTMMEAFRTNNYPK